MCRILFRTSNSPFCVLKKSEKFFESKMMSAGTMRCVRLQTPNISIEAESLAATDQIMIYSVAFGHTDNSELLFALSDSIPEEKSRTGFISILHSRGSFEIATSFSSITLLQAPYSSHCLVYDNSQFTRTKCLENCQKKIANRKSCEKQVCRPLCHVINWYVVSYRRSPIPGNSVINFPEQVRVTSLVPSIHLVDYVANLLSIISFWSGICIFTSATNIIIRIKMVKMVKPFFYMLILIGLLIHSFIIIQNYMKFHMLSNVSYQIPDAMEYPKITIIFIEIAPDGELPNFTRVTPFELSKTADNSSKLIWNISVAPPNGDYEKQFKSNEVKNIIKNNVNEYYLEYEKLITIDFDAYFNQSEIINFRDRSSLHLCTIRLNNFKSTNLIKYTLKYQIHFEDTSLFDPLKSFTFSYAPTSAAVFKTKLLMAPFETNCVNYENAFKSKQSWYKCLQNKHKDTLPFYLIVEANSTFLRHAANVSDDITRTDCIKKHRLHSPCSKYSIKYGGHDNGKPRSRGRSEAILDLYLNSFISCTLYPKTTPVQLMIILGGVIGTWSGINLFTFLMKFNELQQSRFTQNCSRKRKPKYSNQVTQTNIIFKRQNVVSNRRSYVQRRLEAKQEFANYLEWYRNSYIRRSNIVFMEMY